MSKEVTVILKADTQPAVEEINKVNKSIKDTKKSSKETQEQLNTLSGGAIGRFKALKGQVLNLVKSFKSLRFAIAATGIGALVLAVVSLVQAFKTSEEGQNKFTKFFNTIQVVIGNVTDILSDFGSAIINVFTGNFDEARKSIDAATESIKNFGSETRKEIEIMNELSDASARADKLERALIVKRAEANRTRADLLEKAVNKEKFSLQERIGFLEEAGRVEEEITNKEIEAARIRFEFKKEQNKLSKSTKEDLDEEANLQAALIELETAKLSKQKEVTSQIIGLKNEQKALDEQRRKEIEDNKVIIRQKTDIEKIDTDSLPKLVARKAEEIKIRTNAEDMVAQHIRKLSDELTAEDIMRIDELHQRRMAEANQRIDITSSALTSIGQIADAFAQGDKERAKKAFNINKGIGIAQATISTAQGIMNELSHPVKTLTFTNYAAAAAMALAGAAQIATISATKFDSGGGAKPTTTDNTGGGSLTAQTQAPIFNVVGQSGFNQVAGALGQQQPVQAFVVAGDVTTAQQLQNNTIQQATF